MTQDWEGSRDRISSDATIDAFTRMSDQGFIENTAASSGVVIGEFSVGDNRGRFVVKDSV
jgi:hypothetical protein